MVAFLLIGVGSYAKTSSIVVTLPVVGGIVACGVFLLFVAILGLIATMKHHQVMLFFYMMILFAIFVIQFSVACACIGFTEKQEQDLAIKVNKNTFFDLYINTLVIVRVYPLFREKYLQFVLDFERKL